MVRLIGPLHSDSASGRIGGRLTFSMRKGRAYARFQNAQEDAGTEAQLAVRAKFSAAKDAWNELSPEQKAVYNKKARYTPMSGYALFIKQFNMPAPTTPLIHYLLNDNLATTTVVDSLGLNNAVAPFNTEDRSVAGKINEALDFTGGDSPVISDELSGISGSMPRWIAIWAKISSSNPMQFLSIGANGSSHIFFGIGTLYDSSGHVAIRNYGEDLDGGVDINDDEWHWIYADYNGTTERLFLDNVLVASQAIVLNTTDTEFRLNSGEDAPLTGVLDDARAGTGILTDAQRDFIWNGGDGTEDELPS